MEARFSSAEIMIAVNTELILQEKLLLYTRRRKTVDDDIYYLYQDAQSGTFYISHHKLDLEHIGDDDLILTGNAGGIAWHLFYEFLMENYDFMEIPEED